MMLGFMFGLSLVGPVSLHERSRKIEIIINIARPMGIISNFVLFFFIKKVPLKDRGIIIKNQ